ncbi:MAG: class II aldolase/adducin family protein [Acidimicrobiia bacterium]
MVTERPKPSIPTFETVEAERRHRKQRLAAALRLFGAFGFDEGFAGHITARDPELTDHFWVNPIAMNFKQIRVRDLLLVNHKGEVVEGTWRVNTAAFVIHSHIHTARPDVVAAAHSHSTHGRAFSTLRKPLKMLTQDSCVFYNDHALYESFGGVVLGDDEGKRVAHALGGNKAAILSNHGLLTVGDSVDAAAFYFISMERTCQVQLLAEAAGTPVEIDAENAQRAYDTVGGSWYGWLSFQPLYDWITATQPDLLEED